MTTKEIAQKYVELNRTGQHMQALEELFAKDAVSIEPKGSPTEQVQGLDALKKKNEEFATMVEEMHGMEVSDPIVADNFFSCSMKMDITLKGMPREHMEEVCLYHVKDGKITSEQFFYTPPPMN
ncbi:nuclear transport factor 2 family protein [uncultured Microscilla sp.]|uniref:nuclear transport factor 2 family protein n=1 Tax=uncultured Microscilla sp. TaxID=432653 RepID=UPI00263A0065|nr:nuclear transport factor 2 family protein [uncultured Microscilla sp.]